MLGRRAHQPRNTFQSCRQAVRPSHYRLREPRRTLCPRDRIWSVFSKKKGVHTKAAQSVQGHSWTTTWSQMGLPQVQLTAGAVPIPYKLCLMNSPATGRTKACCFSTRSRTGARPGPPATPVGSRINASMTDSNLNAPPYRFTSQNEHALAPGSVTAKEVRSTAHDRLGGPMDVVQA